MMFQTGIFAGADARAATTCSTSAAARNLIQREVKAFAIVAASTNETRTLLPHSPQELSIRQIRILANRSAVDPARTKMSFLLTLRTQRMRNRRSAQAWDPTMNYSQVRALHFMLSNL